MSRHLILATPGSKQSALDKSACILSMFRFKFFVSHGIDSRHVAPLDVGVIYAALRRISARLKNGREFMIECLADEINEEYMISVKKAIIDFVLRDPRDDEYQKVSLCNCTRKDPKNG